MKTIPIIYAGSLPEIQIEIGQGMHVEATRQGKPVLVPEPIAQELLKRGDFIPGKGERNGDGGAGAPE